MAYPILAPTYTWYKGTTLKTAITLINIVDSYSPTGNETESWNADVNDSGDIKCYITGTTLTIAGNGSGKIAANEDSSRLFGITDDYSDFFKVVTSVSGLYMLDTSNVTNMSHMFSYMYSIGSLDLSTFDTSKVTSMDYMFSNCRELINLNISNWNTSKVTTMSMMFAYAKKLTIVQGLDSLDTSSLLDMSYMFLESVITDIPNFDTSKVTNMRGVFMGYTAKEYMVFPDWDTSNVTNMSYLFCGGQSGSILKNVDISKLDTSNVENMEAMFLQSSLETIDVSNFNFDKVSNVNYIFYQSSAASTIILPNGFTKFNNNITSLDYLFRNCSSLKNLDVSNWDVSNITSMYGMFQGCSSLQSLDVSNWDVSKVTDMGFMFYQNSKIKEIDVSKWDTSKLQNIDHFAAHANLVRKGMGNWNTSSLTNANAGFHNCAEEELDLSGWDVSKVEFFSQMFENSPNLKRIKGLENWDTSNGVGFEQMFGRCYALEELDLSSFDTRKAKNNVQASTNGHKTLTLENFFNDCRNLKKLKVGLNFSVNGDGTNTTASYKAILPTTSADYIEGADGYWYTMNGDKFAPDGMKDKTAETYYASYDMVSDMDVIVKNDTLISTAKAIKDNTGSTDKIKPSQFSERIGNLAKDTSDAFFLKTLKSAVYPEGVTSVSAHQFYYFPNLESVVLNEEIQTIGVCAFEGCTSLSSINLPDSVTSIGTYAFSSCSSITSLTIPNGVTSITGSSFRSCSNLVECNLPDTITDIGTLSFYANYVMEMDRLPTSLTTIGDRAFGYCYKVTFTELPVGVTTIPRMTFFDCREIPSFTFHSGVVEIGEDAFGSCDKLTTVTFEGTPQTINARAFYNSINLTTINVPWAEGAVANAPWGATNATINYNYVG